MVVREVVKDVVQGGRRLVEVVNGDQWISGCNCYVSCQYGGGQRSKWW